MNAIHAGMWKKPRHPYCEEPDFQRMLRNKRAFRHESDRNFLLDIPQSELIPDRFLSWGEKSDDVADLYVRIRRDGYETSDLKLIVDAYEKLGYGERYLPWLALRGKNNSYNRVFRCVRHMNEFHDEPHIYYGSARIFRHVDGFHGIFEDRVRRSCSEKPSLVISVFWPLDEGKIPTYSPYDALEHAAQTGKRCCIYMLASSSRVYAPLGSSLLSKVLIKLSTHPGETVITFNDRRCK